MTPMRYCALFLIAMSMPAQEGQARGLFGPSLKATFTDSRTAELVQAAMAHKGDRVAAALKNGADIKAQGAYGLTALHWAVMEDDTQAINILLDAGADPNWYWVAPNGTDAVGPPVWLAASKKHHDALRLLLKRGGNVNTVYQSSSALMAAIQNKDLEAAKILLDAGADINFQVNAFDTSTAMLPVSAGSNDEIALWLLDHGYNKGLERFRNMLLKRKARFGQEALRERLIKRFDEAIHSQAANFTP